MKTEVEVVMTREYWEKNYRREYRRELREDFVGICKEFLGIAIAVLLFYGVFSIIAIAVETLCNII